MQGQTFVFFGIVGSGKGTQVKLLQKYLKTKDAQEQVYVGTGEIFRKIIESGEDNFDTRAVKGILNSGRLIPDNETNKLVSKALESELLPDKHVFFDGYPRTLAQAQFFEDKMNFYERKNIKVIYIELSREEATKRNLLRGRHDDTREGLEKRFDEYMNNVVPAMNYFKDKGNYEISKINGEQSIERVHQDIISKLGYSF